LSSIVLAKKDVRCSAMPSFTATITKQWIMRGVEVPAKIIKELGGWQTLGAGGKGLPVVARYGGETLTSTKLDAGDRLTVGLAQSSAPQEPTLPEDLRCALQLRPSARSYFERATPATRRWVVRHLDEARRPETRQNRLEKIIERFAEHGHALKK
jgi:hypothetical protein